MSENTKSQNDETGVIYEIKTFRDSKGRMLTGFIPLPQFQNPVGVLPEVLPRYSGEGIVSTGSGRIPFSWDFPAGWTMEQCFANFEKVGMEEVNRLRKEHASKIITPADVPGAGGIIIPK